MRDAVARHQVDAAQRLESSGVVRDPALCYREYVHSCTYVCMCVCNRRKGCMYVCVYIYIYIYIYAYSSGVVWDPAL